MLVSKQDVINQMAKDPSHMANMYLNAHERIEQLVVKIEGLEKQLQNPRGNT